ncbi:MAG: alpha-IPM isomerase [Gemmatimonadetes bacterium]|nr:alpha-IPM isomerase [Gemmatimonadota bacterium]
MQIRIEGRARVLGDDVNTDYIVSSSRKKESLDPEVLKNYLLESVDRAFADSIRAGDVIVAGKNFGCGSAMEVAATVILAAGIRAVLAKSFARTYYRNAVNNGLIPVECATAGIEEGDRLLVVIGAGRTEVRNETKGATISGGSFPRVMLEILEAGGLVPYIRRYGGFRG